MPPTPTSPPQRPRFGLSRRWILFALALLALNLFITNRAMEPASRVRVPYSPFFLEQVTTRNVAEITSKGTDVQGMFKKDVTFEDSKPTTRFRTEIPAFANTDELSRQLEENDVTVNAEPLETAAPWWQTLLFGFGPTILFVALLFWLYRRAGNVQNALGAFGRSRARRYEPSGDKVTFADVAGIEEAKDELTEVVDFLGNPDKYRRLGGRIPHGVLLSGPPGTGKTLLARAVAGEANVPFYSLAASEFVEAIVGVGASRVRDLFREAKENAPSIVFIDELDAIGRSRTSGVAGFSGGNDEREQTLNQILTEMDGFNSATSVIVIGATNRPDVLDQALLRPGRFDRRVAVQPPDRAGREAILRVHTRGVPLAAEVDLARIAAATPGMAGADLANLVNEAALTAARRSHDVVEEADFTDALERIVLGAERKVMLSDGRSPADGLPRGRARDRRDADAGRRSRAQGLDHPAGNGARRDVLRPRRRPLQLPGAGDPREDQGRPRRPGRRGARLRRDQHRRRVRHRAADRPRPAHGGALGDERCGRADRRAPPRRVGPAPPRRDRSVGRDAEAPRRGGAPHRRRGARRGRRPPDGAPRPARRARERAARKRDAGRGRRVCGCRCHAPARRLRPERSPRRRARRAATSARAR